MKKTAAGTARHQTKQIQANTLKMQDRNSPSSVYTSTPNFPKREFCTRFIFTDEQRTTRTVRKVKKKSPNKHMNEIFLTSRRAEIIFHTPPLRYGRVAPQRWTRQGRSVSQVLGLCAKVKIGKPRSVPHQNPSLSHTHAANEASGPGITT